MTSIIHPISAQGRSAQRLNRKLDLNDCVLALDAPSINTQEGKWYDQSIEKNSGSIIGALRAQTFPVGDTSLEWVSYNYDLDNDSLISLAENTQAHNDYMFGLITWEQYKRVNNVYRAKTNLPVAYPYYGKGLSFDGVDDYVMCPNDASLGFGTGDFTLEAWVYSKGYTNQGSAFNGIMCKGRLESSGTFYGFFIASNEQVRFSVISDSFTLVGSNIKDGWHHLVGYRDGLFIYLYVDGVYQDGMGGVASSTTSGTEFYLGRDWATNRYFNGMIDQVKIYNRALTEDEIVSNYNQLKEYYQ